MRTSLHHAATRMRARSQTLPPNFERLQRPALIVGAVALVVCVVFAIANPTQFFQSYLYAFLFWAGMSLGSLSLLLIQHLTGGAWGATARRFMEAGAYIIPLVAILFVPVLLGMGYLYPWTQADYVATHPLVQRKSVYLNIPFFVIRQFIYFGIWTALAVALNRLSQRLDERDDPALRRRMEHISGVGIVAYVLTMTFAAVDWGMSIEPDWYSSMYAVIIMISYGLSTLSFLAIVLHLLRNREPVASVAQASKFHDIGSLMFAFTVLWTYTSFAQYLIIWSSNTTVLAPWYAKRGAGGWEYFVIALIVFQFFVPFFLLLQRRLKRTSRTLAIIAGFVLFMQLVNMFWIIVPSFHPDGVFIHPLDILALIGVGGIWLAGFIWALGRKRLIPLHVPALYKSAAH